MTQHEEKQAGQEKSQGCAPLESRYRDIGIQAVAAAKTVKARKAEKQDDLTIQRLQQDATD